MDMFSVYLFYLLRNRSIQMKQQMIRKWAAGAAGLPSSTEKVFVEESEQTGTIHLHFGFEEISILPYVTMICEDLR